MATNTTTIKEGLAKELLNDHQKEIESFQSILADFNENIYSLEDKLKEYIEDSCGHMRKYIEENVESYDELNIKLDITGTANYYKKHKYGIVMLKKKK